MGGFHENYKVVKTEQFRNKVNSSNLKANGVILGCPVLYPSGTCTALYKLETKAEVSGV